VARLPVPPGRPGALPPALSRPRRPYLGPPALSRPRRPYLGPAGPISAPPALSGPRPTRPARPQFVVVV